MEQRPAPDSGAKASGLAPSNASGRPQAEILMRSVEFRRGREDGWKKLDSLVGQVERNGIRSLSAAEAQELPLLYRSAMSSLSVARAIVLDRNLLLYLEDLTLRAYFVIYGPRASLWGRLRGFIQRGFPQAVRAMRWHVAIAAAVFLLGLAAGYALTINDMNYFTTLVPAGLAGDRGPASTREELLRTEIYAPFPGFTEAFIVFANSLFRHNTMVGILCFGLGFIVGLPTIMLLVYNGLVLGAFIALHADKQLTLEAAGWLSIHGVTELSAIFLCGAAGLVVGQRVLFPGRLSRLDSLSRYGLPAASVAAGTVGMFFIAGILEGGFRQLINVTEMRLAIGLATGALWIRYFASAGRTGVRNGEAHDESGR